MRMDATMRFFAEAMKRVVGPPVASRRRPCWKEDDRPAAGAWVIVSGGNVDRVRYGHWLAGD
jgi:hypothetical protein